MSEGRIAGRSEPVSVVITPTVEPSSGISHSRDIGIDIMRYFNVDFNTDRKVLDKLEEISKWAFRDVETTGDGLMKLKRLEMKLGIPTGNDTRENKIYNWIRIQQQIDDLHKRQEALR